MIDIIKLYNPAKADSLTPEEVTAMQSLTDEEIKQLAISYPNVSINKAYLLIIDNRKPIEKQLPTLSTFENLWNLKVKNSQKWFVPYAFKNNFKQKQIQPLRPNKTQVVDLSDVELMSLPGFKVAGKEIIPPVEVEVKKIKKTKIQ